MMIGVPDDLQPLTGVSGKLKRRNLKAIDALEAAIAHQERAKKVIQGISEAYHTYNLETGVPGSAQRLISAF